MSTKALNNQGTSIWRSSEDITWDALIRVLSLNLASASNPAVQVCKAAGQPRRCCHMGDLDYTVDSWSQPGSAAAVMDIWKWTADKKFFYAFYNLYNITEKKPK